MRFVKASERKPVFESNKKQYVVRYPLLPDEYYVWDWIMIDERESAEYDFEWLDESLPADDMPAFQNEPVTFLLSNALRHLTQDQQRQLCNALQERLPLPVSIEDEAERIYPYIVDCNEPEFNVVSNLQRSAHITCARQYMDTIEKLRAENSKMRKALESIQSEKMQPGETDYRFAFNRCWHIATSPLK